MMMPNNIAIFEISTWYSAIPLFIPFAHFLEEFQKSSDRCEEEYTQPDK